MAIAVAGHASGWPIPRGGSQKIADSLAGYFRSLGGEIVPSHKVTELPQSPLVMCDISPHQLLALASGKLPASYGRSLEAFRYGPGVFKLDWALEAPVPWRAPECARAGTIHLGGTFDEIAMWERSFTGAPFVLAAQPSLFDSSRAPRDRHTLWAYCHVPGGSGVDMTAAIEAQVERFAPGFRSRILARAVESPADLEHGDANLIGGAVTGGMNDLRQTFFRPTPGLYRTPLRGVFLCSASTPPGGGVHGMCGFHAARWALRSVRG